MKDEEALKLLKKLSGWKIGDMARICFRYTSYGRPTEDFFEGRVCQLDSDGRPKRIKVSRWRVGFGPVTKEQAEDRWEVGVYTQDSLERL